MLRNATPKQLSQGPVFSPAPQSSPSFFIFFFFFFFFSVFCKQTNVAMNIMEKQSNTCGQATGLTPKAPLQLPCSAEHNPRDVLPQLLNALAVHRGREAVPHCHSSALPPGPAAHIRKGQKSKPCVKNRTSKLSKKLGLVPSALLLLEDIKSAGTASAAYKSQSQKRCLWIGTKGHPPHQKRCKEREDQSWGWAEDRRGMEALQSQTSQILFCNANPLGRYSGGYHKIKLLEQNYLHVTDYTYTHFSPLLTLHSMFWREHIPKKDQIAVQFCLTSITGLVGSSSLSTSSSSACFSLSFFFFFFLTGSPSSTAVPSVPQKGQKRKAGCQLLRVQKEKL